MNANFEEVNLRSSPRKASLPQLRAALRPKNLSHEPSSCQMTVALDKTPTYITASQRLHLRKQQMNQRIARLKDEAHEYMDSYWSLENEEEEIQDDECVFNVPIASTPVSSLTRGSLISWLDRQSDTTTTSSRSSSIMSRCSHNLGHIGQFCISNPSLPSWPRNFSCPDLNPAYSNDALELSLKFEECEMSRIVEDGRKNRNLLCLLRDAKRASSIASSCYTSSSSKPNNLLAHDIFPFQTPEKLKDFQLSTRPAWLPPKTEYEKLKHARETEDVIIGAIKRAGSEQKKRVQDLKKLQAQQEADQIMWSNVSESQVRTLRKNNASRQMYWRGVPDSKRAMIWRSALQNRFTFLRPVAEYYFGAARNRLTDSDLGSLLQATGQGMKYIYPEMEGVQTPEAQRTIDEIAIAVILYLDKSINAGVDAELSEGDQYLASDHSNGIRKLSAIFYEVLQDRFLAFNCMCAMLSQDDLLNALVAMRLDRVLSNREVLSAYVQRNYLQQLEQSLLTVCPRLRQHFNDIQLETIEFAPELFLTFFSGILDFNLTVRIIDLWLLEGNSLLIATLVALLKVTSHKLFGSKADVLGLLRGTRAEKEDLHSYMNTGYEFEFVLTIRDIIGQNERL